MANKNWDYVVSYVDPDTLHLSPGQREELDFSVKATSVPRALSKAKAEIKANHEGIEAGQIVVLDIVREKSPLVKEFAPIEEAEED